MYLQVSVSFQSKNEGPKFGWYKENRKKPTIWTNHQRKTSTLAELQSVWIVTNGYPESHPPSREPGTQSGPSKRKLIFHAPSRRCYVSGILHPQWDRGEATIQLNPCATLTREVWGCAVALVASNAAACSKGPRHGA